MESWIDVALYGKRYNEDVGVRHGAVQMNAYAEEDHLNLWSELHGLELEFCTRNELWL